MIIFIKDNLSIRIKSFDSNISLDLKCNMLDKSVKAPSGINACVAKNINSVSYWTSKDIKFLINPFDSKGRYFDYSTIRMIKKNNIWPVILLNELSTLSKKETCNFLRNAILFSKLCNKLSVPIIIDSGKELEYRTSAMQEHYNYTMFGYTIDQAIMFNDMLESELNEKRL